MDRDIDLEIKCNRNVDSILQNVEIQCSHEEGYERRNET